MIFLRISNCVMECVFFAGDLILKHSLVVNHLEADTVNGWPINQFVTLNTDQTIESDIFITKFFAVNVQANKVNDIDFKRDLVTVTANTIINSKAME